MLIQAPPKFRRHRRPAKSKASAPPPPPDLVLVSAMYLVAHWVRLTFDRPIDISAIDPRAIVVDDGTGTSLRWKGAVGASFIVDPTTVQVGLDSDGASTHPGVHLDAGADSG